MGGHKKSLYKLKKFDIISSTFTEHNDRKLKNQCIKICGNHRYVKFKQHIPHYPTGK
jgi:RNase P/RNase MRP subunit p30